MGRDHRQFRAARWEGSWVLMVLRYYDAAGIEAEFNPSGAYLRLRPSADFRRLVSEAEGVFTVLGGTVLVLLTTPAGATLFVGQRSSPLQDVSVAVSGGEHERVLEIHWPTGDVDRIKYTVTGWIESDPTPGVDREDFDFGLFLRNVRYDLARQQRMCGLGD